MKIVKMLKQFKVVTVSKNRNSFGLAGVILMAKDGEAYEVGACYLYTPIPGDIVNAEAEPAVEII